MTTKTKTFFEDLLILFIIGLIIYAIYSLFFSSDEKEVISENISSAVEKNIENLSKTITEETKVEDIEKKVEESIQETQNEEKNSLVEPINENSNSENKIEAVEERPIKQTEKTEATQIPLKIIEEKPKVGETVVEKPIEKTEQSINQDEEKAKIEAFYQTIRDKINSSINRSNFKTGEFVNIRLTILKDGRYEQLTFNEGNKEYFEQIKPSIYKVFPISIDESLKHNFPRYFRMKIEF